MGSTYSSDLAGLLSRTRDYWARVFGGLNLRGEYERTMAEGQALEIALLQQLLAQVGGSSTSTGGTGTSGGTSGTGASAGTQLSGGVQPTASLPMELTVATVGDGSSPTSLVMQLGSPPQTASLSSAETSNLKNARIVFLGGSMAGQIREVSAITAAGVITPDSAYTTVPTKGMQFVLIPTASSGGGTSSNIASVGGTAQTGADWTPLLQGAAIKQGALTDGSGTITTGGSAQQIFAANTDRRYLLIQNVSTANEWINFGTSATESEPSIQLVPGGSFEFDAGFVDTELVSIIGATTGQAFTAKQG